MNLLKLKAKVLLGSEEQMEVEDKHDFGNIAKSKDWVWRNIAVLAGEVYKIIEFNRSKSIVEMNNDEKILVDESFEDLFAKWQEAKSDGDGGDIFVLEEGKSPKKDNTEEDDD